MTDISIKQSIIRIKSPGLEVIRGMAASMVFIGHLIDKLPEVSKHKNHLTNLFTNWATESVIVFFVLSGFVIHSAFEKKPRDRKTFLIQRAVRIYPTLFIGLILTLIIDRYVFHNPIDVFKVICNLIPVSTLQGNISQVYWQSNPVIWSLSYEMFFYLIFSIGGIKKSGLNHVFMYGWLLLSLLCLPLYYIPIKSGLLSYLINMFAYSSIWIMGFLSWNMQKKYKIKFSTAIFCLSILPLISRLNLTTDYYDPLKYLIFAMISMPLFTFISQMGGTVEALKKDKLIQLFALLIYIFSLIYFIPDTGYQTQIKILYAILPILSLLLNLPLLKKLVSWIYVNVLTRPFYILGKWSYSLYVLHYPLMMLIYYVFPFQLMLKLGLIVSVTVLICIGIENYVQPWLNKLLLK